MSTIDTTQPPAPPAQPPMPPTAFAQPNPDAEGRPQVTRNVPPKRVMVLPGNQVTYGGKSYQGGDTFLLGEGPAADNLQLQGHIQIVDHEQVDEWNGKEGDAIRKAALAHIDKDVPEGADRGHDHGFVKYEHADGPDAEPSEHTTFRQQDAQIQRVRGMTMDEHNEMKRQRRGGKESQ